jgi:hypothetical protein
MRSILKYYKWYLIAVFLFFGLITAMLIYLGAGPQKGPFQYQIF